MRLIIRTIVVVAILWIGVLLSGYGVLFHSEENVGGLGLKCQYLTARGVSTALYVHSNSGVIGVSSCPLLRKSATVDRTGDRDDSAAVAECFSAGSEGVVVISHLLRNLARRLVQHRHIFMQTFFRET